MRIGLSTSVIQRGQTGVGQYVLALVRAFRAFVERHEFSLFVLENDLPLFRFTEKTMRLIPVAERFRAPVKNILWHQTQLPALARRLQLDVLHVPSYRRLLWPRPCPQVATIHDLASFHIARKYDWKRMLYARVVVPRLMRRQDKIIAISETTARDITACFGLPAERITMIHNGIDHGRFFPGPRAEAKAALAERYRLDQPFFLYVARLEYPAKNHVRLIAAFNQFKAATRSTWQLALAGGDWHGAEVIHAAVRQSPFARDIRCLGFVSDDDLPTLYRAAEVFVYPSLYEGFGLPPVEAMACGCPVLSSTRGALREVVGDATATADPEDTNALIFQLTRLVTDAGLREHLRASGLNQAARFDWRKSAAATLEVYERAAVSRANLHALFAFAH